MLTVDQSKRITAADALKHPWIVVCCFIYSYIHFCQFSYVTVSLPWNKMQIISICAQRNDQFVCGTQLFFSAPPHGSLVYRL